MATTKEEIKEAEKAYWKVLEKSKGLLKNKCRVQIDPRDGSDTILTIGRTKIGGFPELYPDGKDPCRG